MLLVLHGDERMAMAEYQAVARDCGLLPVKIMTEGRKAALSARIADAGGIDGWLTAMGTLRQSRYALGEGQQGWRIDFDTLVRPDVFARVAEGVYRDVFRTSTKPEKLAYLGEFVANLEKLA